MEPSRLSLINPLGSVIAAPRREPWKRDSTTAPTWQPLEPVSINARLTHFYRAIVTPRGDGTLGARLTGPQGSGILTSMSRANALLVVPEDRPRTEAGEELSALLLTEDAGRAEHFSL